jgi:hypothetical protein
MMLLYLAEAAILALAAAVAFGKSRRLMAVGFLLCTIPPLMTAIVVVLSHNGGIPGHITFVWRYGVHGARILGFILLLVGVKQTERKVTESGA